MAVAVLAAVVMTGLAGVGRAPWTDAAFTDTAGITGNTLGTATLQAPTALVVTANAGTLVLTWGATSSTYADGYYVYRAAASGGPYTNVATVAGRATATWTDATPPAGTSWYKLAAYRVNWNSVDTAFTQGAAAPFLSGSLVGTTVPASWTAVTGASSYNLTRVSTGGAAKFARPDDVAFGPDGSLYVADSNNNMIRKVTTAGLVTTLAGNGGFGSADGAGSAATFNFPWGVAVAADGTVYVADSGNQRIRKITPAGVVTTLAGSTAGFADGTGGAAQFDWPRGIAVAADGSLYVADQNNNRIRKVTTGGVVSTWAGQAAAGSWGGTGAAAAFNTPMDVALAADGTLYVADQGNNQIRKITPGAVVSTLAGSTQGFLDGTGAGAQFNQPRGVALAANGTVYVADTYNYKVRKVSTGGVVTTLAGSTSGFAEGTGATAQFTALSDLEVDAGGTVYVSDTDNDRIRQVTAGGAVTTLAGSTTGFADNGPVPVVVYSGGSLSYSNTGLVAGIQYTYTVTAVGPGGVSNTIGPFVP